MKPEATSKALANAASEPIRKENRRVKLSVRSRCTCREECPADPPELHDDRPKAAQQRG